MGTPQDKVVCPSCHRETVAGFDNVCFKCGADTSGAPVQRAKGSGFKRLVRGLVRLAVFVGILTLLVLLFWPMPHRIGADGDAEMGALLGERLGELVRASQNNENFKQRFPERAINGYFETLVADQPGDDDVWYSLKPDSIRSNLSLHQVDLVVRTRLFTLPVTYSLRMRPTLEAGRMVPNVEKAWIGRLPMPWKLKSYAAGKVKKIFREMDQAQFAIGSLSDFKITEGQVTVAHVQSAP